MARCQIGRGDGDAEPDRVAIGHEDEGGATGISGDREDGEAASEERVGRVGYLDLFGRGLGRVIEWGIKVRFRWSRSCTSLSIMPGPLRKDEVGGWMSGSEGWCPGCSYHSRSQTQRYSDLIPIFRRT